MQLSRKRRLAAVEKELRTIERQEQKLGRNATKEQRFQWKTKLEEKLPPKIYDGLQSAFCKAFSLVFEQGRSLLEKSYNKDELLENYSIRDYAVQVKGRRKQLRQMHKSAKKSDAKNLALTTVEGIGLGALGIGIPDIVLFISTLLKGIYEAALHYGHDYTDPYEQLVILKMMAGALSRGEDYLKLDQEIDRWMMGEHRGVDEQTLRDQMQETASVFAVDMLLLKFVQGLPLIGVIGGAANPVYYRKILNYVQMKYRKRYLLHQRKKYV